uniref:Uncharacterized protein n=1 Tax=Brassica campestris TaxID=3711 RepID=M4EWG3_BRACM
MEMRNASNVGQSESYAHRPQLGHAGESCSKQAADTMIQGEHQSSGKRIASQIVTPSCQVPDDNVTKRARVSPRLLTFSPKETVLPGDAPIIGALNDMEIMEPCMEDGSKDALLVADDHEDDLLGADLMDMEANVVDKLVVDVRMPDKATVEKHKPSSSYKNGGRSGFPLGVQSRKAEFLRRGYPKTPLAISHQSL